MCGVHLMVTPHYQLCGVHLILTHSPTDSLPHNPRQMHNDGSRWSNSVCRERCCRQVCSNSCCNRCAATASAPHQALSLSFSLPLPLSLSLHPCLHPSLTLSGRGAARGACAFRLTSHPYKSPRTNLKKCRDCLCIRLAHTINTNTAFF